MEASRDMGDALVGVRNVWRAGPATLGSRNLPPVSASNWLLVPLPVGYYRRAQTLAGGVGAGFTSLAVMHGVHASTSVDSLGGGGDPVAPCGWGERAMRQRILGSHTPLCHRHMVITTLSPMFCLAALQRKLDQCRMLPGVRHSRWLSKILGLFGSARSHHPPTAPVSLKPLALWASLSALLSLRPPKGVCLPLRPPKGVFPFLFALPTGFSLSLSSLGLCLILPPPLCLPVLLRRTAVHTAACSAACRGTLQRSL